MFEANEFADAVVNVNDKIPDFEIAEVEEKGLGEGRPAPLA